MEYCRIREFEDRISLMIGEKSIEIIKMEVYISSKKDQSDIGIAWKQYEEDCEKMNILTHQMARLQKIKLFGYKDPFIRNDSHNIIDCPENKSKMSLVELAIFRIKSGGIKNWFKAFAMSASDLGSDMAVLCSLIILGITFPVWIWFHLWYRRNKMRKQIKKNNEKRRQWRKRMLEK